MREQAVAEEVEHLSQARSQVRLSQLRGLESEAAQVLQVREEPAVLRQDERAHVGSLLGRRPGR